MASKLGFHSVIGPADGLGDFLRRVADSGRTLAVAKCVDDFGRAGEALGLMPGCLTVGRINSARDADGNFVDLQAVEPLNPDGSYKDPRAVAAWYFGFVRRMWELNPHIKVWETFNEFSAHWAWQGDFYIAMMDLAEGLGRRIAGYACSTGNPPGLPGDLSVANQFVPFCREAKRRGHYLSLHEYREHAGRYRQLYDLALIPQGADCQCIITEAAPETHEFTGIDPFMAWVVDYDAILRSTPYVAGAALFTLGGGEWIASNYQAALPALADHIVSVPVDEPPPPPPPDEREPYPYARTVHLIPQDTTEAEYDEVRAAARAGRQSIVYSANDAFITHEDLTERHVVVWAVSRWGGRAALEAWVLRHYPPLPDDIVYREFAAVPPPPPPPPPPVEPFTLMSPMPSIPLVITHPFNEPRDYNRDGVFDDLHEGVDLRAKDAAGNPVPVVACADGVVEQDQDRVGGGYGITVVLRHDWPDGNAYRTWYAHLTSNDVSVGQRVRAGERIGLSGTTGNSTGIHLHLNLQWIGRGLSGYVVPDVVDPAPYLPETAPPPPPPPPATKYSGWYGLGDAEGGALLDAEIECARRAGLFVEQGNQQGCWLWYENQEDASWEPLHWNGTRIPYQRQIRRLDFFRDSRQAPHFYVNGLTGIWDLPIQQAGGFGNLGSPPGGGVVLGNEPNIEAEGLGRAWTSPADFCQTLLLPVIQLIRQHYSARYPALKLISPPMSPQPNTTSWWDALRDNGILALCHGMGVHTYWRSEFDVMWPMESIAGGRNYEFAYPYLRHLDNGAGGKLWITEVSNNFAIDSDMQKGDQYARWLAKVPSDRVQAVMFFAVQGGSFDATRETWVRQGGVISGIPAAFRMRWALIP